MSLNNCHICVMRRKQKYHLYKKLRLVACVIALTILLAGTAACRLNHPEDAGTQPFDRIHEQPLVIPVDVPLSETDAAMGASLLDRSLEDYDGLRPGGAMEPSQLERVEIIRVVDGDTFIVMRDDRPVRLRLIGLDAPESYSHHDETLRTHEGESVARIVTAWLTGRQAYLQFDVEPTDPYDRLLAYLWLDAHTMVNEVLVREGLAWQHRYPPNTSFNDYFERLEQKAKDEGRGIWGNRAQRYFGYDGNEQAEGKGSAMKQKTIYLAGGCFWGVERYYQLLADGILETETGYANGTTADPTYQDVCRGDTGYAETVRIGYDPDRISLTSILAHFFRIIDPTARDHQGPDYGDQYRPGIYYTDEQDFDLICDYIDARRKDYSGPIVVEILALRNFYPAEEWHQDYLLNNPSGYCHVDLSQVHLPLRPEELPGSGREAVNPGDLLDPRAFESHWDGKTASYPYTRPGDDDLRERLTGLQYRVTRENDTERPFTNAYDQHFEPGLYVDIVSGEPLFSSRDKYDAGCGWPSFSRPVAKGALIYKDDDSLWRKRVEVRSGAADSHLGHVFEDGPQARGGLRYCINSAALRFIPLADMERLGYGDWISEVEDSGR